MARSPESQRRRAAADPAGSNQTPMPEPTSPDLPAGDPANRKSSVRRTSQSHRLMRTVLERLRDYNLDEVRALRDKHQSTSASGRSTASSRRTAPPDADPPSTASDT